jgi:hypothetical protein
LLSNEGGVQVVADGADFVDSDLNAARDPIAADDISLVGSEAEVQVMAYSSDSEVVGV